MTTPHDFASTPRRVGVTSLLVLGALVGGCSPSLPSPPAALLHLATPDTGGEGVLTVTGGASVGGEVFGPTVVSGSLQARYGVAEWVDLGIAATAAAALDDQLANTPHRGIYAARGFAHLTLVPRWLAFQAGFGGGGSAAGGYVSPDVGFTFGYENPWAIPYAHASFLSSIPVTRNRLDLSLRDDSELILRTPYTTIGTQFGLGMRFPLGPRPAPYGSIFLEVTQLVQYGDDPADPEGADVARSMMSVGVAYQHRFGRGATLAPAPTPAPARGAP